MQRVKVIIADDDADVREALTDVLSADVGFTVVAAVGSGDEAVRAAQEQFPDVVILDVRMPGGGAAGAAALTSLDPKPAVVVVSAHADVDTLSDLLRSGATGYLVKGRLGNQLADVVRRCAKGHVVLDAPAAAEALSLLIRDATS